MSRAMKDSGIPWLGEIPSSWQVGRVKQFYSFITGFTPPSKNDSYYDIDGTPWITIGDMKGRWISQSNKGISKKYIDENNPLITPKGSLLYSFKLSVGQVALTDRAVYTNEAIASFLDKEDIDLGFLFYSSQVCIIQNANENIYGAKLLNQDLINNALIIFPPLKEQKAIADFLDKKCSEIDEMVSLQEKIVEELKAYKQSVIAEAVCKGLNPDVPMKDSGIEWIGQISEKWEVLKTLWVLNMPITDGPHTTPDLFNTGIPFVSAEAVSCGNGGIDFNHIRGYISQAFYEECCMKYVPQRGDVYMIKSGATTGKVSIVETDTIFTIWSPLAVFRANPSIILPRFLFYSIQGEYYQEQVRLSWTFGTQQNIGMRTLETLLIVLPPIEEQEAIVDYLDTKCAEIDTLISLKQSKIEALKEYKKSIIYEYITGKKEING